MTEKIKTQIEQVRQSGVCNRVSVAEVQISANERNFYELVCFIDEQKTEYLNYIFFGEKTKIGGSENEE